MCLACQLSSASFLLAQQPLPQPTNSGSGNTAAGPGNAAAEQLRQQQLENAAKNFGPGSPSFGQPFFYTPSTSPAAPQLDPNQATLLPPPTGAPSSPVPVPSQPQPQAFAPAQPERLLTPAPTLTPPAPVALPLTMPANSGGVIQEPMALEPPTGDAVVLPNGQVTWVFNFQGAPWMTVLRSFAKFSGMSLIIDQPIDGTFTYFDERPYQLVEALDVLNDHLIRQGRILVRNESKLTLIAAGNRFREGTVPFVHMSMIQSLGRNELVSVAFPLSGNGAAQIMPELQQLLSPLGNALPLSNSNRIIITDTGSSLRRLYDLMRGSGLAATEVTTHVIRLRNTSALEVANAVNQRLGFASPGGGGSAGAVQPASAIGSIGSPLTGAPFGGVAPAGGASAFMGGAVGVVPEPLTNTLLIEGTPDEIARIDALVRELDRDPGQVTIQALLVEVVLGNTNELGAELGFQDSVLFDRSVINNLVTIPTTTTAANGVQTTSTTVLSQTSTPGFNFNGAALGNNTSVNPSNVGRQGLSNLGVGRINGDLGFGGLVLSAGSNSVNVLLRALAERHKLDVLSRPHIRTVNNREALIQIGQQVPVIDGVTLSPNGLANPVVRQDKAGIILRVIPRIAADGLIQINVQAEKSAYQLVPGSGVPIFTDASNGNVIEAPVKDITTAQTTVTAMSGQTIVLGGMITRDESKVERKVPLLGDIPLLGRLFRYDYKQNNRKELLIFLTPSIVNTAAESDCIAASEAERISIKLNPAIDLHRDFNKAFLQAEETQAMIEEQPFEMIQQVESEPSNVSSP